MTTSTHNVQLCTFRLGCLYIGVDVLDVLEVLYQTEVCRVPHASPAVAGLINVRGQIATTIEMRALVGMEPRDPESRPIHVVVRSGAESVSLLVDEIGDVVAVDPDRCQPPPETMAGVAKDLIVGAYELTDELLVILDVDKVVTLSGADGGAVAKC